jgi:hypothetical protein
MARGRVGIHLSYGGVMSAVIGVRWRGQCILGAFQDPPLPLSVGLHQGCFEQRFGIGFQLADELESGRPDKGLRGRRVQQRRARDVPSLRGDLIRNSPAENQPAASVAKHLPRHSRRPASCHCRPWCSGAAKTRKRKKNARSPDGVALEAVGAPGQQLPDAVQVAATRGQMQRRAARESAGASARVKCMTHNFPKRSDFFHIKISRLT